jgi:hypothetical protein
LVVVVLVLQQLPIKVLMAAVLYLMLRPLGLLLGVLLPLEVAVAVPHKAVVFKMALLEVLGAVGTTILGWVVLEYLGKEMLVDLEFLVALTIVVLEAVALEQLVAQN